MRPGRAEEPEAVVDRTIHRLLVRQDVSAPRFELQRAQDTSHASLRPVEVEAELVAVVGRRSGEGQRVRRPPLPEERRRALVPSVGCHLAARSYRAPGWTAPSSPRSTWTMLYGLAALSRSRLEPLITSYGGAVTRSRDPPTAGPKRRPRKGATRGTRPV